MHTVLPHTYTHADRYNNNNYHKFLFKDQLLTNLWTVVVWKTLTSRTRSVVVPEKKLYSRQCFNAVAPFPLSPFPIEYHKISPLLGLVPV